MTTFPPCHLPFFISHLNSTSLPFLSLFLSLSSSSSQFSYKQQPHSSHKNTPQWGGTNPPLSLLISHFPFSNTKGFQDFKEEEKASTPSPPAPIQHHHHHHHLVFTAWITCGQGFKMWFQDLHAIHTVYFDLAFKFMPLCCLFILCIS